MNDYITVKQAAKKWGYSESTVRKWCREGKIYSLKTAEQKKPYAQWKIPADAQCPHTCRKR